MLQQFILTYLIFRTEEYNNCCILYEPCPFDKYCTVVISSILFKLFLLYDIYFLLTKCPFSCNLSPLRAYTAWYGTGR